jgi:type VI secretion system protein ImpJ
VIVALRESLSVVRSRACRHPARGQEVRDQRGHRDRSVAYSTAVFICGARRPAVRRTARRFPAQLKIGPVEKIRDLVTLQLPGVPVVPVPVAPRQIPYHAGYAYFELDQISELWDQLKNSGGVALHIAGEFPGLALEFWAIRGN